MVDIPGLDALRLVINPIVGAIEGAGPHAITVTGTVNVVGGGAGGTATTDNSGFVAGASSLTPIGGYQGGRSVASGHVAALAIDGSGVLMVDVIAGGGGGAGFATAAVYGSPAFPVYVVGSVNLGSIPTVNLGLGTVNIGNAVALTNASVAVYGSPGFPVYNIGSVNVVNTVPVTGGGFATMAVYGSPAFPAYFQFPSGYYPTLNIGAGGGGGTGFATAGVYGSPAFPVYAIGTVNVSNVVNVLGTLTGGTTLATVGVYGSVSIFGSVNVGNFPGVQVVDTRGSLVPTQWIISGGASGQFSIAGTAPESQRIYLSSYHLTTTATCDAQWMSPSGVAISGSIHLLPGTSFIIVGGLNSPVLLGSLNSGLYIRSAGTQNIGGVAVGWVA